MPRITILMPARNAAATIKAALKSTLLALPKDGEILVWDDASSDSTRAVVESLTDARLRLHHAEQAVGSGSARRQLMEQSDSEYVACMDADDLCFPWRFTPPLLPGKKEAVAFSPMVRFRASPRHFRVTRPIPLSQYETAAALIVHNPLAQPTMIARRSEIDRIGGYSDSVLGQDYELWLRAAASGLAMKRGVLPTVAYRVTPSQATQRPDYRARFTSDPNLQRSYRQLVASALGDWTRYARGGESVSDFEKLRADLQPLVAQMSPLNRRYYQRILSLDTRLGMEP